MKYAKYVNTVCSPDEIDYIHLPLGSNRRQTLGSGPET
jgi:hypothetical protein